MCYLFFVDAKVSPGDGVSQAERGAEMTTTVEHAAEIRSALKTRGWNAQQVSVRSHLYSLGSSIRIT